MDFKKHNVIEFYFSKKSQIKLRNFCILTDLYKIEYRSFYHKTTISCKNFIFTQSFSKNNTLKI
ncbi:hypothetical protein FF021_04535 [Leptospira noguchii]|nr:hypothetical protein FF021_04535 [Leptospira noguchii]